MIDLRPTVNDELWLSFRIFKSLRDVPREPDPSRDWDRTLSESYGTLNQLGPMTTGRTEALVPLLVTIMAEPKVAAILKSDGFTDEQIAAFPTGQRILLAERIWLLRFIGTQERAINLSYPESVAMSWFVTGWQDVRRRNGKRAAPGGTTPHPGPDGFTTCPGSPGANSCLGCES